jgi:hypothetical protein
MFIKIMLEKKVLAAILKVKAIVIASTWCLYEACRYLLKEMQLLPQLTLEKKKFLPSSDDGKIVKLI